MPTTDQNSQPKAIYLKDYKVPDFLVKTIDLEFELTEKKTRVISSIEFYRNSASTSSLNSLELDGANLTLESVALDNQLLAESDYEVTSEKLVIKKVPNTFKLQVITSIKPQDNTLLMGLYKSNGMFCTQCESEGFRRITYFLDRPDVMASYTTKITADKTRYPVLLSNGNLIDHGDLSDGRHWVKWQDPFKKPSYLFALVAGNLAHIEGHYTTTSGRKVTLKIYAEQRDINKCHYALQSLKKAMQWDEENYGREYDLDIYMIVAASDFNMGAMENKGLNVFNTKYVLADAKTATDQDFINIDMVVAHEYFHNWTGNRITCRDWFQLCLKEGLTVFRDQSFTADQTSAHVKRIQDVKMLRSRQFPQDAGPLAHPVRPQSYIEMNNFYTVTVYEKGAEIYRMLKTILGPEAFRQAMDLYFERYDGQAITIDHFVTVMQESSGIDLSQFKEWYERARTPQVEVKTFYDERSLSFRIDVKQSHPDNKPFYIPLAIGLLDSKGNDMSLKLDENLCTSLVGSTGVLAITDSEQQFVFHEITEKPVASLLRGFSAPIKLNVNYSDSDLAFLMAHDNDGFNQWEAANQYATRVILRLVAAIQADAEMVLDENYAQAFGHILIADYSDKALQSYMLELPEESYLGECMDVFDIDTLHEAREFVLKAIAQRFEQEFLNLYNSSQITEEYRVDPILAGRRRLQNVCLKYLSLISNYEDLCFQQFNVADNMTNQLAALEALTHTNTTYRTQVLKAFYQQWQDESLVIDKWFTLQAIADVPEVLEQVQKLTTHPSFTVTNPNKVRSLIGAFCTYNLSHFHNKTGAGYKFLVEWVIRLDSINAMVAARLVEPLTSWRRFGAHRQELMQQALKQILALPNLSKDVYEVVSKSLYATE